LPYVRDILTEGIGHVRFLAVVHGDGDAGDIGCASFNFSGSIRYSVTLFCPPGA
jgi:hypothetical protein